MKVAVASTTRVTGRAIKERVCAMLVVDFRDLKPRGRRQLALVKIAKSGRRGPWIV